MTDSVLPVHRYLVVSGRLRIMCKSVMTEALGRWKHVILQVEELVRESERHEEWEGLMTQKGVEISGLGGDGEKCGLKWEDIGAEKPMTGSQVKNARLAQALQHKLEFTREELDSFNLKNLTYDAFCKSGAKFFRPVEEEDEVEEEEEEVWEQIAELVEEEVVGEENLLFDEARAHALVTSSETVLMTFTRAQVEEMLRRPEVTEELDDLVAEMLDQVESQLERWAGEPEIKIKTQKLCMRLGVEADLLRKRLAVLREWLSDPSFAAPPA
jgi:CRP-like cAMP-binding protein